MSMAIRDDRTDMMSPVIISIILCAVHLLIGFWLVWLVQNLPSFIERARLSEAPLAANNNMHQS